MMAMVTIQTQWFVAAGVASADGSREKPFHDLWQAARDAGPGDTIHIAAGAYFGRYDRSSWIIDCPRLSIIGGYSRDFSARMPWKTPSIFGVFAGYESTRENNLITGRGDHSGLTIDGLCFDSSGANIYGDKLVEGIRSYPTMAGAIASFNAPDVTIRNCVFANSATGGVELSGAGSRFENNLLINLIGPSMLDLRGSAQMIQQPIVAKGNSFCFIHDVSVPAGSGADMAIGIRINCPASVQENIFVGCGNAAISLFVDPARVAIDSNLFFLTPRDILVNRSQCSLAEITEKNLEEMEDIGVKSAAANVIENPQLAGLKAEWLDAWSRHLLANYLNPPRDTINAFRSAAGLAAAAPADLDKPEQKGGLAPRLAVSDVLALSLAARQGAHPVELPAAVPPQPATAAPVYRPIEWTAVGTPDPSLADVRVELRAALGMEQNAALLSDATPETHMGVRVFQPGSDDVWLFVLIARSTLPARQYDEAIKFNRGMDAESTYLLRGTYRTGIASSQQKMTMIVESIVPGPPLAPPVSARPAGRDWFVKAGSTGGDGTREKPFRDPFQALEKVEGGDAIHVAGGDYFGKLRSGRWNISIRNLALLGGYNADFSSRDPWAYPVRFLLHEEEKAKGTPAGTILFSEENSDGLIVDGFIFDGLSWNQYGKNGSLDFDHSPNAPLISLRGARAPVTVRNCLFVNGSAGAVIMNCSYAVFENNIILNTSGDSLVLRADGPGPCTIRNNTLLFACDPTARAGTGKSSSGGTLLQLSGRAAVDVGSNIFAFADNFGARSSIAQQNVSFDRNIFAANLFNHLTDAGYLWADSSNWERRAVMDSAFASIIGTHLELPTLPVDPGFADAALSRLFTLPSRISQEDWKTIARQIGSSATPAPPAENSAAGTDKTTKPAGTGSLDDLLAQLGNNKPKPPDDPKAGKAGPVFCPLFDWKKALILARNTPDTSPGARRVQLAVSFAATDTKADVQYVRITAQQIDAGRASLDNKPVELDVTQARDSSTNSTLFPSGMGKDNYEAYSVSAAEGTTRTRIAIVVKLDTAASRFIDRATSTDTVRIRGTARTTADAGALSVVVDTAEAASG
jgi:hypothetical protein